MSFHDCKIVKDNCAYDEYHKQDAKRGAKNYSMSRSELVEFASCPAKYILGPQADDSTPATDWGSMIDCLLTSPDKFDELFAVTPETYPDTKTGEPKPWTGAANFCKAWKEEQGDKKIIKAALRADADLAVKAIQENPDVSELIKVSRKQVFVIGFWKDPATKLEIPVRILIDLVPPADHPTMGKWLADFKTARNGDPAIWARVVDDNGYDIQAALYSDIYCAATKEDRTDWVYAVQENIAPFHVVKPMPAMTAEFMQWGRVKYQSALTYYCQCLSKNDWPSYRVAGLQFGATQLIGPESLWTYKQSAGQGSLDARTNYHPTPTPADEGEVIP
jgi:hypothetical protein